MYKKEDLLKTGCFIDNEFLEKYMTLLQENQNNESILERHHIIPKCYYKMVGKEIDNSNDNIVDLTIKNHLMAHYYLANCISNKILYHKLAYMFSLIAATREKVLQEDDIKFIENLPLYSELRKANYWKGRSRSQEQRDKIRAAQYKRTPELQEKMSQALRGKKRSIETRERMRQAALRRDKSTRATGPLPDSVKKKISETLKGRKQDRSVVEKRAKAVAGLKWFNNGIQNIRARVCPEGYVPGIIRLKKEKEKLELT